MQKRVTFFALLAALALPSYAAAQPEAADPAEAPEGETSPDAAPEDEGPSADEASAPTEAPASEGDAEEPLPETSDAGPEAESGPAPEAEPGSPEPEASTPEPEALAPEPEAGTMEPDAGAPVPDVDAPAPDAVSPEPVAAVAPAASVAEPEPEPEIDWEARRWTHFEGSLHLGLVSRSLDYTDDVYGFMREYELGGAPRMGFDMTYFPGRHVDTGLPAMFGIHFDFDHSLGLESERSDEVRFPTNFAAWELAGVVRHVLGEATVRGTVGYGSHQFEFEPATIFTPPIRPVADLPSVDYRFFRIGGGARYEPVRGLQLDGDFSYLAVLDAGGIEDDVWFPRSDAGGIEAAAQVSYVLENGLGFFVGFDWRRFFLTMNPQQGDPFIVGGALDQVFLTSVGINVRR